VIFKPVLKYSSSSPVNLGQRDLTDFKYVSMAWFKVIHKKRVTPYKYNPFIFLPAPLIDETSSYFPLLNYEVLYRVYAFSDSNQGEIADLT
jgi:hypothetical protein